VPDADGPAAPTPGATAPASAKTASKQPAREKTAIWRFLAGIIVPALLILGKYTFRDAHKVPARGAFIMTPNHYTDFDPLVAAYAVWKHGRVPRFLAKASLFKVPVLGAAMRATGQIPVERATPGTDPLAAAAELVQNEFALIIYPVGTLTRDPDLWPMRGKYGAARLALHYGVPVIPMATWGAQRVLPRWSKKLSVFPRKPIEVIFGDPVDLSRWMGKYTDQVALAEATLAIMQAITALVEQLRGETAPVERWDPADHGQAEFGRLEE
jgi:1-acyl-sn-glycerol-3-phosphate acyltransferase